MRTLDSVYGVPYLSVNDGGDSESSSRDVGTYLVSDRGCGAAVVEAHLDQGLLNSTPLDR